MTKESSFCESNEYLFILGLNPNKVNIGILTIGIG